MGCVVWTITECARCDAVAREKYISRVPDGWAKLHSSRWNAAPHAGWHLIIEDFICPACLKLFEEWLSGEAVGR